MTCNGAANGRKVGATKDFGVARVLASRQKLNVLSLRRPFSRKCSCALKQAPSIIRLVKNVPRSIHSRLGVSRANSQRTTRHDGSENRLHTQARRLIGVHATAGRLLNMAHSGTCFSAHGCCRCCYGFAVGVSTRASENDCQRHFSTALHALCHPTRSMLCCITTGT